MAADVDMLVSQLWLIGCGRRTDDELRALVHERLSLEPPRDQGAIGRTIDIVRDELDKFR